MKLLIVAFASVWGSPCALLIDLFHITTAPVEFERCVDKHFLHTSCIMRLLPAGAPRLGLGLAALGRPGYITLNRGTDLADRSVEAMRARAEEVLDAAYAGGVRWFDCARSYGLSEDFVGKWLEKRGHSNDAVAVSSKWGYRRPAALCAQPPRTASSHPRRRPDTSDEVRTRPDTPASGRTASGQRPASVRTRAGTVRTLSGHCPATSPCGRRFELG